MKVRVDASGRQAGHSRGTWLLFWVSLLLFGGLVGVWFWNPGAGSAGGGGGAAARPLVVYCAAGIRAPVEEVAREYEARYGVPVQLQYGGSMTLLANLQISRRGDLYLPADDSYLELACEKGLVAETLPLAVVEAVLAVRRGNPKQVRSLEDLLRAEVALGQANPDAAAIGKVTRSALVAAGRWESLRERTRVFKPTVNELANDIKLGSVDAGFVWAAIVTQYPELEAVLVPELKGALGRVGIGVLVQSLQPAAALRFARYLAARDRGLPVLAAHGYTVVAGDPWAERPELRLLAGAMLRPAIEETIAAFERREGVRVVRVYNGCGILVAQLKGGERPDAYFSCDNSFMEEVADLFVEGEEISQNWLVIVVAKGNPRGIRELQDLARPGLRVGVGNEQQGAMGALTRRMLMTNGTYQAIRANVKVETPTGDMLVNQLRTGSLDAVIAYLSNATGAGDAVESIRIDLPGAIAIQPVAIGRESRFPQLTARLLNDLRSGQSQARFEEWGFQWKLGEGVP